MVTKSEEAELERLESQADHGGGGVWEYLSLVRKLKVRRSDKVLKHGLEILNHPKKRASLGDEGTLYRSGFMLWNSVAMFRIGFCKQNSDSICSVSNLGFRISACLLFLLSD